MKINVLMPVFNSNLEWLKLAVESVIYQDHPNFNIILVDDFNPKGAVTEYLYGLKERDCCLNIVRTQENKGIAAALDYGLQFCQGDLIVRMDHDDIAAPNLLTKHDQYFTAHPDRHICGIQIRLFSHTREWESNHPLEITRKIAYLKPGHWFMNHPGSAYRPDAIRKVGGYGAIPADCPEDYSLWVKFLLAGYTLYNVSEILMDYRVQPKSFSHVQDRQSEKWHSFLEKEKAKLYEPGN